MELEWRPVTSEWITHEAYDAVGEAIYVRFHNGVEWRYDSCPQHVWDAFTAQGQSRGKYFHAHLKYKPHGRHG